MAQRSKRPRRKGWFNLPRMTKTDTSEAVEQLARLLNVPDGIFEGPLPGGSLNLDSLELYRADRLSRDYLSKYPGFAWGNPRDAAIKSFRMSELECASTNERLHDFSWRGGSPKIEQIFSETRLFIGRVLGRFDWGLVRERSRFGPGVTSSCKGIRVGDSEKFGSSPDVSPSFAKMGMKLVSSLPSWSCLLAGVDYPAWVTPLPSVVPGNRVTFVPKNAKTDRSIAIEPTVNIYFQLGVGALIRERLKKAGLDLDTQANNQALACLGSMDDSLSTIDLERASDTLASRLVECLLPDDWFAALNALRSQFGWAPWTVGPFSWRPYSKFSSMGNGFTFELESLIFWALSSTVASIHGYNPFWCTAFGDDIIAPSGCYDELVEVLHFCGFTVNLEKSYHMGPFRESCGKDFLRGSLVRPVYLKEVPDNPLAWIKIANNLKRLAHTWASYDGLDCRLKPAYDFAVSMIPADLRSLSVSDGYGDVALIRDFDEAHPSADGRGWEGFWTNVLLSRPVTYESKDRSLITAGACTPGRLGNRLPLRGKVEHTIGPMYVASWRTMGAWKKT